MPSGTATAPAVPSSPRSAGRRRTLAGRLGREQMASAGGGPATPAEVLASSGYEPRLEHGRMVFANCPFEALARHDRELVCGLNVAFVTALLDELGGADADVRPDPGARRCCVTLAPPAGWTH